MERTVNKSQVPTQKCSIFQSPGTSGEYPTSNRSQRKTLPRAVEAGYSTKWRRAQWVQEWGRRWQCRQSARKRWGSSEGHSTPLQTGSLRRWWRSWWPKRQQVHGTGITSQSAPKELHICMWQVASPCLLPAGRLEKQDDTDRYTKFTALLLLAVWPWTNYFSLWAAASPPVKLDDTYFIWLLWECQWDIKYLHT